MKSTDQGRHGDARLRPQRYMNGYVQLLSIAFVTLVTPTLAQGELDEDYWDYVIRDSKEVIWTMDFGGPEAGKEIANYEWNLWALAQCSDWTKVKLEEEKTEKDDDTDWDLSTPLNKSFETNIAGAPTHPEAKSFIRFKSSSQVQNNWYTLTTTISGEVGVNFGTCGGKKRRAVANSNGALRTRSKEVEGYVVKDSSGNLRVAKKDHVKLGEFSLGGSERTAAKGGCKDPISIELLEIETQSRIVEELFTFDVESAGRGALTWDDVDGIVLSAQADGTSAVSINGGFDSTWITDSVGMFSASLRDGVFTATGALNGLAWDLTYDGPDVVNAQLIPTWMPILEAEYMVPEELIEDDYTYRQTLILGDTVDVEVSCCPDGVPALSAWGMGAVALLLLAGITIKFGRRCRATGG